MNREEDTRRAVWLRAIVISLVVSSVFLLIFYRYCYWHFPKTIVTFRGDWRSAVIGLERKFELERGPEGNLWALEVEFLESLPQERIFAFTLNGSVVGSASVRGRKLLLSFSGSLLREGINSLRIDSTNTPWQFQRVRIKNISGYSSGFFAAVIFPKENDYPEARAWPPSPLLFPFLFLLGIAALVLNLFPSLKRYPPQRAIQTCTALRFLIPVLFLGIILIPQLTGYRVLLHLPSALSLIFLYYVLAYLHEIRAALRTSVKKIGSIASLAARFMQPLKKRFPWKAESWLAAVLLLGFAFICLVYPGPGPTKGDSLEYYAMLVSWAEKLSPYLTPESCAALERMLGRVPQREEDSLYSQLSSDFPNLVKNSRELDLPHFWFYSLCAGVFYWPLKTFSAEIGLCFSLLHIGLLVLAFFLVRRKLGGIAGLSLLLLVYISPLLWFSNKAHTEFFTVVLAIVAVAFFVTEGYAEAALFLALASTQNPPFALLAFLVFLFGLFRKKWILIKNRFLLWPISGLLMVIHPLYYYLRHGFLNPVVGGGGARMRQDILSLKKMLCFILDPDIGLFANWPISLLLLALFAVLAARKRAGLGARVWLFLGLSVPILLWSQSRTGNVNHGGTIHISRYALWFFYIFFLLLWQIGLDWKKRGVPGRRVLIGIGLALGVTQLVAFWPQRKEDYLRPTWVSRLIYDHLPALYNPVPEVFIERQIGLEIRLPDETWAVSNKSGNKIYVQRNRMRYRREKNIPAISTCLDLDPVLVYREAKQRFPQDRKKDFLYLNGRGRALRRPPELEVKSP